LSLRCRNWQPLAAHLFNFCDYNIGRFVPSGLTPASLTTTAALRHALLNDTPPDAAAAARDNRDFTI